MIVRLVDSSVSIHTPAKLNLFLEVLSRRADGFHEIETLMMPVTLFDTLQVSKTGARPIELSCRWSGGRPGDAAGGALRSSWGDLPDGPDNMVVKAIERLREQAGLEAGAVVRLQKRIPSSAGLGGASSDAAAALVAANRVWNLNWPLDRLHEVAAQLGSDVPFFLGGSAAICRGRGEQIEPVRLPGGWHFVVVRPPQGLSTAEVYRHCRPATAPRRVASLLAAARRGRLADAGRLLMNRLQPAAASLSPWIGRLQAAFDGCNCYGHQMSGSGSSYFGICRSARHARRVAAALRSQQLGAVFVAGQAPAGGAFQHQP